MSAQPIPLQPIRAVRLTLGVVDPEVVAELVRRDDGAERDEYALHALRIGVLAMRHASGAVDVEAIRHAGNDVIATVKTMLVEHGGQLNEGLRAVVTQYFDPKSGSLPQRIEDLVGGNGELEKMLLKHLDGDRSTLHSTLEALVGNGSPLLKVLSPEDAGGVVTGIKNTVETLLKQQRDVVLGQFSLDRKDSALSRLVTDVTTANGKLRDDLAKDVDKVKREFSLDNKDGALTRLVSSAEKAQRTIEKSLTLDVETSPLARLRRELVQTIDRIETSQATFQADVRGLIATLQTRKQEAEKSPKHGNTFEDVMEDFLRTEAQRMGDVYERVGKRPGPSGAKKGDHVISLSPESAAPNARIVIESKAAKNYSEAGALEELAEARENREAQLGIFVFKRTSAPDGIDGFRRVGNDILTVWDPEDATTDLYLRAAMSVARALVVRERDADAESEANLRDIERAVREIEKQLKTIDEVTKAARNVQTKGTHILELAEHLRTTLEEQVDSLHENLGLLRNAEGERDGV